MFFKNRTIKFLCVSFLLLSPLFSACQKSVILKNVNSRANELEHYVNASEDSIILKGDRKVYMVEIFNDNFRKELKPNSREVKIPLKDIPIGRYVILARLKDKLIAISLLRNENYNTPISPELKDTDVAVNQNPIETPDAKSKSSKSFIKNEPTLNKKIKAYWIVKNIRVQLGYKVVRTIATKEQVKNLIAINKKEQKTKAGKFNVLTVWEVYDISAFKKLCFLNPEYIKSKSSEFFNVVPYYKTKIEDNEKLLVKQ